ncbi:probable eukaryotic translation initiation factor 5-1 [Olea europaea subsp. europaea]|uniref:Probable eukaryotic translation initiation factor 5-1 n=1 Tax=Olea europaea subsp. europaea TaxID=158383 RepID=A0A8S0TE15_OLEEU|nr:probable eukaryotic translation initiation factor 5-1 [Olea europaea subsp. europaea]
MALQNIGAGNKDDAFYRYKMPKMITKIEGRGNGIKTNLVNMVDIAKALGRPAAYTTKYFGNELGAQSKFDEKTGTSHVNGAHDTSKLAALLENFIKKYVQCYGCGNPETEIIISKSQMINLKCAACGFISDVDMRDKLTTFILKNPPEAKKGSKDKKAMRRAEKERLKEGEAVDEEQKKLKKDAAKKKGVSGGSKDVSTKSSSRKKANVSDEQHSPTGSQADDNDVEAGEDSDDDVQWQTDTSAEAARQSIREQLNSITASMVMISTNEEKPKSGNNSPAREEKHKINGNTVKSTNAHAELVEEIREFLDKGASASQLKAFLGSLAGTDQEVFDALFEALFNGLGKGFSKEVVKKMKYIAAADQGEDTQTILLHAIESFCGKANAEAVKEVALVLKELYDNDMLEEVYIVEWYQKGLTGSNKAFPIWKNVKPFVEWLQSAESETEDE